MGRIITPESADPVTVMARLFDTHADVIFSYAERRVGATTAHEVVGDVFLIALDRLSTFDPTLGTERGWLYGIANNVLRHHWRSES